MFKPDQVQLTNSSSIKSKASMESKGYLDYQPNNNFKYSNFCNSAVPTRSALINRGYYVRVRCMTENIFQFIRTEFPNKFQIISLGCGYDTTFFRLATDPALQSIVPLFSWYDVDFGELLKLKRNVLGTQYDFNNFTNYQMVSCDIRNTSLLLENLLTSGISIEIPTLIIAECVLTYLPLKECDVLISFLSSSFKFATILVYEQIMNDEKFMDSFTNTMINHFNSLSTPIHSIQEFHSVEKQLSRYKNLGFFNKVCAYDLLQYWNNYVDEKEKSRISSLEMFDEWEDWHIKLSHYFVLAASNHQILFDSENLSFKVKEVDKKFESTNDSPFNVSFIPIQSDVKMFGHRAVNVKGVVYVFGGFGCTSNQQHKRISGMLIYNADSFQLIEIINTDTAPATRMFHSMCTYGNEKILVFGGRQSPKLALNDLWEFDCCSKKWNPITVSSQGSLPCARFRHSSWIYRDKFYVFGGLSGDGKVLGDLWAFDLVFREWRQIQISAPSYSIERHSASSCIVSLNKTVYCCITGGIAKDDAGFNDILLLPLIDGAFIPLNYKIVPYAFAVPGLCRRYSHSSCLINERFVFVIGGVINGNLSKNQLMQCFDMTDLSKTATNIEINESNSNPSTSTPSFVNTSIILNDVGELCSLGGGFNCFSMGSYYDASFKFSMHSAEYHCLSEKSNAMSLSFCTIPDPSWTVPIIEEELTPELWNFWYQKRIPFIVRGYPFIKHRWSVDFLLNNVNPDSLISVHYGTTPLFSFVERNFEFKVLPFSDFVHLLEQESKQPTPSNYYYLRSIGNNPRKEQADIFKTFPLLAESINFPHNEVPSLKSDHFSSILRLTSKDVQLWTHYDVMDNILFQIRGAKQITLWPASDFPYLSIQESSSTLVDLDAERDGQSPFFNSHPTRFILNEGDFLFIPSFVLHHTVCIGDEPSYAVNTFWKNLPGEHYQKKDLYGNKDLVEWQNASNCMNKAKEFLKDLPAYYKEFYTLRLQQSL